MPDRANNRYNCAGAARRIRVNLWISHMAYRSRLLLTAALVGLLSAPAWAAVSDEPVATAPIPPPLRATPPAASAPSSHSATPAPDKPAFVNPMSSKPAPPKAAAAPPPVAAPPKRPVRSAAKNEQDKKKAAAERHRPTRQAKKEKEKEHQHTVAQVAPAPPPARRPAPRPRYYTGDFPPPPPWYDGVPFAGYHPGPWRRPMMPW